MSTVEIPNDMYLKGYKIRIYPTKEQIKCIENYINLRRYIYNWAINQEYDNYYLWVTDNADRKLLSKFDLYRKYTKFKHKPGNEFLNELPVDIARFAIDSAFTAFDKYYKLITNKPQFKTKKNQRNMCYGVRADRVFFKGNKVRIPGFKKGMKVKSALHTDYKKFKDNPRYYSCQVSKDKQGCYWFSFKTMEKKPLDYFEKNNIPEMKKDNGIIGIDLNKSPRFACSDGSMYYAPDVSRKYFRANELQRKMQKDRDRKSEQEKANPEVEIELSKRAQKRQLQFAKICRKVANINNNFIHTTTKAIINKHPKMIVMETLYVSEIGKNHYVASNSDILYSSFYSCKETMKRKCDMYGIKFIQAPRQYPSSQICSCCGHRLKHNASPDRIYRCPACGYEIDRDLNAAINLKNYGARNEIV